MGTKIDKYDLFKLILKTFSSEIIVLCGLFIVSSLFRVAASYMILLLFETVDKAHYSTAYLYTALILVLLYIHELICSIGLTSTYQLGNHIKATLAILLYTKISKMTYFVMKNA